MQVRPTTTTVRSLRLVLIGVLFIAACGSQTVETTTNQVSAPEQSSAAPPTDSAEKRSVPFEVIAEGVSGGEPFNVAVIADDDEFAGLQIPDADIDFSSQVVFVFDLAESSSPQCRFQPTSSLIYDEPHQVLYPLVLMEGQTSSVDDELDCASDTNPHRIVVSVARRDLPLSHFSVWIDGEDLPECCGDRKVFVSEGELTRLDGEFPALDADGNLAVGETRILYGLSTHCGVDPLARVIDGSQWTAADPSVMSGIDPMPDGWDPEQETIGLVVERTGQDSLVATAVGTDVAVEYERTSERFGCD